jgi:nicotinamidase-related amidase
MNTSKKEFPIPLHFDPNKASGFWKVDYNHLSREAKKWAEKYRVHPSSSDRKRICVLAVDVQNSFCNPDFELFVQGPGGNGAVEDVIRFCRFIYRNLNQITTVYCTLDSHRMSQIFHPGFLINEAGENPQPYTSVSYADIAKGKWKINPEIAFTLGMDEERARDFLLFYTKSLGDQEKFQLTIWPYHALIGSIGNALVSIFEEALFFHGIARKTEPQFLVKGTDTLTEHYSVFGPEVKTGPDGKPLGRRKENLIKQLRGFDKIFIGGQAKSHCVAWTISDLISSGGTGCNEIVNKLYLLEDCTSPVVVPGMVDYAEDTDLIFKEFRKLGLHCVKSTDPLD